MRILLDECIDENLRHSFTGHECHTCRYAGLKGIANGELLAAAEQAGYDVLITVDKNMPHQQSLSGRGISVIVLDGRSTDFNDLVVLIPNVLTAVDVLQPGQILALVCDDAQRISPAMSFSRPTCATTAPPARDWQRSFHWPFVV